MAPRFAHLATMAIDHFYGPCCCKESLSRFLFVCEEGFVTKLLPLNCNELQTNHLIVLSFVGLNLTLATNWNSPKGSFS